MAPPSPELDLEAILRQTERLVAGGHLVIAWNVDRPASVGSRQHGVHIPRRLRGAYAYARDGSSEQVQDDHAERQRAAEDDRLEVTDLAGMETASDPDRARPRARCPGHETGGLAGVHAEAVDTLSIREHPTAQNAALDGGPRNGSPVRIDDASPQQCAGTEDHVSQVDHGATVRSGARVEIHPPGRDASDLGRDGHLGRLSVDHDRFEAQEEEPAVGPGDRLRRIATPASIHGRDDRPGCWTPVRQDGPAAHDETTLDREDDLGGAPVENRVVELEVAFPGARRLHRHVGAEGGGPSHGHDLDALDTSREHGNPCASVRIGVRERPEVSLPVRCVPVGAANRDDRVRNGVAGLPHHSCQDRRTRREPKLDRDFLGDDDVTRRLRANAPPLRSTTMKPASNRSSWNFPIASLRASTSVVAMRTRALATRSPSSSSTVPTTAGGREIRTRRTGMWAPPTKRDIAPTRPSSARARSSRTDVVGSGPNRNIPSPSAAVRLRSRLLRATPNCAR